MPDPIPLAQLRALACVLALRQAGVPATTEAVAARCGEGFYAALYELRNRGLIAWDGEGDVRPACCLLLERSQLKRGTQ